MRFEDLSPAEQQLVNTDFGELDKQASEHVAFASECYDRGFFKMAGETADAMDEQDEEKEKTASEVFLELSDEQEKTAAEAGAFVERGYFDGLRKLGSDRHGDEMHYLYPLMAQKVAEQAYNEAYEKVASKFDKLKNLGAKGKEMAMKAKGHAMAAGGKAKEHARAGAAKGKEYAGKVSPSALKEHARGAANKDLGGKARWAHGAKATGIAAGYGAAAGGAGYAGYRAAKKD